MTDYIKLGPIGDAFSSTELGLYLIPGNAAQIDDSILNNRLINFTLTGFIVQITQVEYDNIKLSNQIASNNPINSVPISQPYILQPVEDIVNEPPTSPVIGKYYLVINPLIGTFQPYKDYIAQYNGIGWTYIKPVDGMILPVYSLGISLHYTGTYPSGSWDTPSTTLTNLANSASAVDQGTDDLTPITNALNQEIVARQNGDASLAQQIANLPKYVPFSGKAGDVTILDSENAYTSGNVEGALGQIASRLNTDEQNITNLTNEITDIIANGNAFQFIFGTVNPDDTIGNLNDVYLNTVNGNLYHRETVGSTSHWILKYYLPTPPIPDVIQNFAIGTSVPITLDFTTAPLNVFVGRVKCTVSENLTATQTRPRFDIPIKFNYTDNTKTQIQNIVITPDSDGSNKSIENFEVTIFV